MIEKYLSAHKDAIDSVCNTLQTEIYQSAEIISNAFSRGGKVLLMGNGGSAADSQHFAAELVGRFVRERQALPAIALTTDSSILTAVGNDYGFDSIFTRQIDALASSEDVVIGISTSGHSENVRLALQRAREKGCSTIGLTGRDGGPIGQVVDVNLLVPVQQTAHVQEAHITVIHILCELVEQQLTAG